MIIIKILFTNNNSFKIFIKILYKKSQFYIDNSKVNLFNSVFVYYIEILKNSDKKENLKSNNFEYI